MNQTNGDWDMQVQNVAKAFPYPPPPDVASRLRRRQRPPNARRLAQAAALLLIAMVALLAVPEIRAQVLMFFRIGAVEVIITTATPPAMFASGNLPESVLDFPGATTLADAEQHAGYPIPLPDALGAPDRVYLIDAYRPIVVLAWLDTSGAVEYSLHLLPPGTYSSKMYEGDLEQTEVNGERALWLPNPHPYLLRTGATESTIKIRQVTAHALMWATADEQMTYRLETNHPLEDALRIAESVGGNG
ncbi:MAG: hypothetical protein LC121_21990 [Anaerolineae bacterium]|nr:hypothetical protein [Anaerolineae bacterium]